MSCTASEYRYPRASACDAPCCRAVLDLDLCSRNPLDLNLKCCRYRINQAPEFIEITSEKSHPFPS